MKHFNLHIRQIRTLVAAILMAMTMSSCFTGVEGTKKISLSRDDRKSTVPTPEEQLLVDVKGTPLLEWEPGREFYAADNRTLLIFDQEGMPIDPDIAAIGGKTLKFAGTDTRLAPDGTHEAVLLFRNGDSTYRYNTGKTPAQADTAVRSDLLPMMIDMDMVTRTRSVLAGKKLWTRTLLWYSPDGKQRLAGRKFVPVTVVSVEPGDIVFPVIIGFVDDNSHRASVFMNYGNSGKESRSFANQFMLSDLRKHYPAITDEVWTLICSGRVAPGMTKEECRLALGTPTEVDAGRDYTQTLDLWKYPDGRSLWFEDGILTRMRM